MGTFMPPSEWHLSDLAVMRSVREIWEEGRRGDVERREGPQMEKKHTAKTGSSLKC